MSEILEELEEDREVCSNCYRKAIIWVPKSERMPANAPKQVENMVADGRYPGKESEICYPTTASVHDHSSSTGIACKCGAVDSNTKVRPLSKERLMECAKNIHERLIERGYDSDEDELLDVARSMKEDPNKQFDDRDILSTAIEDSLI